MKILMIMATMLLTSRATFALDQSSQLLAYSAAEIIAATASVTASTQVSTLASEARKMEARRIQRDVQDYNQNGSMSVFLADKVSIVKTLDLTLSIDESVDVLLEASEIILSE